MAHSARSETEPRLLIERFDPGPFATNCYLVSRAGGTGCWLIDVGFSPSAMLARVRDLGLNVDAIVLTHAHADHIAGVAEARRAFPKARILIHEAEAAWLNNPTLNLSAFSGASITAPGPDRTLSHGDTLSLDGLAFTVLHTPGHSPGSISLHQPESRVVFAGDTLFQSSIGRTDFPGGDLSVLTRSIRTVLYALPEDTVVYPGHGPSTTIAREKHHNPFIPA